jgi:hypothetical protein
MDERIWGAACLHADRGALAAGLQHERTEVDLQDVLKLLLVVGHAQDLELGILDEPKLVFFGRSHACGDE